MAMRNVKSTNESVMSLQGKVLESFSPRRRFGAFTRERMATEMAVTIIGRSSGGNSRTGVVGQGGRQLELGGGGQLGRGRKRNAFPTTINPRVKPLIFGPLKCLPRTGRVCREESRPR